MPTATAAREGWVVSVLRSALCANGASGWFEVERSAGATACADCVAPTDDHRRRASRDCGAGSGKSAAFAAQGRRVRD